MELHFSVTALGPLPGSSMSHATALNNRGEVTGWSAFPDDPFHWMPWTWRGGVLSPVTLPLDGVTGTPVGINDAGQIVGGTYLRVDDGTAPVDDKDTPKALSVTSGGMTLGSRGHLNFLPFLSNGTHAEFFRPDADGRILLRAINNAGQILGWVDTLHWDEPDRPPRKTCRSFVWHGDTRTEIVGPGGGKFQAYALNDAGWVVGTAEGVGDWSHAHLWREGVLTDLGTLGRYSTPSAINASGQVVGSSASEIDEDAEDDPVHGFLWENGVMTNLDGATGRESRPLDINAFGQIVGELFEANDGPVYGFLRQDSVMYDLNTIIDPGCGWKIKVAVATNDHGQIACNGVQTGAASEREEVGQGLLLTPV